MTTTAPTTAHDLGVYYSAAHAEHLRGNVETAATEKARVLARAAEVGVTLDTAALEATVQERFDGIEAHRNAHPLATVIRDAQIRR